VAAADYADIIHASHRASSPGLTGRPSNRVVNVQHWRQRILDHPLSRVMTPELELDLAAQGRRG
jgi:hypothetical protein